MTKVQKEFIYSFTKTSLFTFALIACLLGQVWATNRLANNTLLMDFEFTQAAEASQPNVQKAAITVQDKQLASFAFDDFEIDIKTTFFSDDTQVPKPSQIFAELKINELDFNGESVHIHTPALLVALNEWAEVSIDNKDGKETLTLKVKFNDPSEVVQKPIDFGFQMEEINPPVWLDLPPNTEDGPSC